MLGPWVVIVRGQRVVVGLRGEARMAMMDDGDVGEGVVVGRSGWLAAERVSRFDTVSVVLHVFHQETWIAGSR